MTNDDELDFAQIIAVLRKRWWLLAALAAGAAITAFTVSSSAARRFESTAVVRVSNPNANRLFAGQQPNIDPKRLVETETKVLLANDVRLAVEAALGPRDARIDGVEVTNPAGTDLLEISVTSGSPELARDAADTYASVYVNNRRDESSRARSRIRFGCSPGGT